MLEPALMKCRLCGSKKSPYIETYVPLIDMMPDINRAGIRVCCQECGVGGSAALFNKTAVSYITTKRTKHRAIEQWNDLQKRLENE